jgi:hypothetical protein
MDATNTRWKLQPVRLGILLTAARTCMRYSSLVLNRKLPDGMALMDAELAHRAVAGVM